MTLPLCWTPLRLTVPMAMVLTWHGVVELFVSTTTGVAALESVVTPRPPASAAYAGAPRSAPAPRATPARAKICSERSTFISSSSRSVERVGDREIGSHRRVSPPSHGRSPVLGRTARTLPFRPNEKTHG